MVTASWVLFDLIMVIWTSFLTREISTREKLVIAMIGIGVAVYGGYSEHRDSDLMSSLKQGQDFTKGQLNVIGKLLATPNIASINNLKRKLESMQHTVGELQSYKNEHEAEVWPALTDEQQKEWISGSLNFLNIRDT